MHYNNIMIQQLLKLINVYQIKQLLQINLNETRDTVRETNQYVSYIEMNYFDS